MDTQQSGSDVPELTLGWRLKMARARTGMSVREFAEEIGVSTSTVTSGELDKHGVRPITLKMWALRTGVNLQWLETGIAPRPDGPEGDGRARRDSNPKPSDWEFAQVIDLGVAS